jgi:hypothetical protein
METQSRDCLNPDNYYLTTELYNYLNLSWFNGNWTNSTLK